MAEWRAGLLNKGLKMNAGKSKVMAGSSGGNILSVYSPFSDRVGLPLHNIHIPSPFTSIMLLLSTHSHGPC